MERAVWWIAIALAFAGCMGPGGDAGNDTNETPDVGEAPSGLPAPIEASEEVSGGADPTNFVTGEVCAGPAANCQRYPFELNTTATIVADLSWTVPANDFDLYLFLDGAQTETFSGNQPPGTTEGFEADIEPGSYEVVVVPWAVSQDTFTLSVTFEAAGAETETNESR